MGSDKDTRETAIRALIEAVRAWQDASKAVEDMDDRTTDAKTFTLAYARVHETGDAVRAFDLSQLDQPSPWQQGSQDRGRVSFTVRCHYCGHLPCDCTEQPAPPEPSRAPLGETGGPIPLNEAQERAAKEWAADDRLWTTQETVETNLRTFARVILKALSEPPPSPAAHRAELVAEAKTLREFFRVIESTTLQGQPIADDYRMIFNRTFALLEALTATPETPSVEWWQKRCAWYEQRLRSLCAEMYQVAGALNAPTRVLDQLLAGARGEKLPYETVLPIDTPETPQAICESMGTCNPFDAGCGAKFCTYEEMAEHARTYHPAPPSGGSQEA